MATKKSTGKYVDGFVFAVPKKNVAAYKKMARMGAEAWKKCGALEYMECMGEDLKTKTAGSMPAPMSFTALTAAKPGETIWFSFITFKSRAHRDQVNKKVMAYMAKKYENMKDMVMPLDVARMAYGGFSVEVN